MTVDASSLRRPSVAAGPGVIAETELLSKRRTITIGHLGWAAMFLSILIWTFGELPTTSLGNTGNWYRIVLVLFAAGVTFIPLLNNAQRISQAFPGPLLLLLAYGIVAIVSALYVPAHSFYSMWKASEVIIDVLLMAGILSYRKSLDGVFSAYKIIIRLLSGLLVLWWVEALAVPSQAFVRTVGYYIPIQLQGVLPVGNPDGVGYVSALVGFATVAQLYRTRKKGHVLWLSLLLAAAMASLVMAQARTAILGFVGALLVFFLVGRRFATVAVLASIVAIAMVYWGFSGVAYQYVMRGQSEELFTSLSGRVYGWQAAWALFKQSPIVGHGFAAAARTEILGITGASTLHGSVFDVLVGVGLLGLLPWGLAILWGSIRLLRLKRLRHSWFRTRQGGNIQAEMAGMLVLILVGSITGSDLAMHTHTFMLFLVVIGYASAVTLAVKKNSAAPFLYARPAPA